MPAFGFRTSCFAWALGAVLALAGVGFAQPEPVPPPPMPMPAVPELPKIPTGESPIVPLNTPSTDVLVSPGLAPLPGTLADDYNTELSDREKFRTITWRGGTIIEFPNSLLWEPAMAVQRDPRLQFKGMSGGKYSETSNYDTSIGGTMGLFRFGINGADLAYQLDMFGVVQTRLGARDFMAADYRFGIPLTWQRGWWQGKIGYEHTSAHLGDKFQERTGRILQFNAKDELVLGLGRIFNNQFRLYGHLAYAFNQQLPDPNNTAALSLNLPNTTQNSSRADIGFEWFDRAATGFAGTPFLAANVEVRGDQDWSPNFRAQAGWLFRNPTQRMGNARVFIEYYSGNIQYGQFYLEKESYAAIGFGFDY